MILNLVDRRTRQPRQEPGSDWVTANPAVLDSLASLVGPDDWAVDLVLVDDDMMIELNEGYRQSSGGTDVLSFSYLVPAEADDAQLTAGSGHAAFDLKLDILDLSPGEGEDTIPVVGEVILASDFVVRRCRDNDWPAELEFPMLVVHGLLHVLGWDHQEADERQAMQDIEEKVLGTANLAHPLRQRS